MRAKHWLYTIPLRLRSVFHRKTVDAELDEELQFHLQSQIDLHLAKGLSPAEARRAALRITGGLAQIQEECRDMRKLNLLEDLLQDIRYAWRTFAKSPAFTATAILSLALGIGANTAIFSLVDAVLLKSLPVGRPNELVTLTPVSREGKRGSGYSYPAFLELRSSNHVFSGLAAAGGTRQAEVRLGAETDTAQCKIVSDTYFQVLGIQPARGRLLQQDDDQQRVAVISNGYWQRNFDASESVIGKAITLEGLPVTIVGVAPAGFVSEAVGEAPDIWASVSLETAQRRDSLGFVWLNLMGRLKPGATLAQAAAELSVIVKRMDSEYEPRVAVDPGARGFSELRDRFSDSLRILMAIVAVVLLIACANLASLLLARAANRQREIATRLAIGAGRGRILRQLLTESFLLSCAGGALGLLFASWSGRLLVGTLDSGRSLVALDLRPDLRILLFTAAVSLLAGLLFGLAPAFQAVQRDFGPTLKRSARTLSTRGHLKDALIVAQVALSLLLLVTGGLFVGTLRNLKNQDTGLQADHILAIEIGAQRGYQPEWSPLVTRLLNRTLSVPGVQAASVSFRGTLSDAGGGVGGLSVDGFVPRSPEDQRARADWVGPGYFGTVGIPVLDGRDFSFSDNTTAPTVAIINQTMARHFFANSPAVGRKIQFNKTAYEVVGVVRDSKYIDLRAPAPRVLYFAALQRKGGINSLEVRTAGAPLQVAGAVRAAILEVDSRLRIREINPVTTRIERKLSREYLVAEISGFFGGLTLLLVSIGIYGTLAYGVAQRTNEIGVRMALGAAPRSILRMILGDILWRLAIGLIAGVAAVLATVQALDSMLFGLKPTDATIIAGAALLLITMALLAGYLPARRASQVDPLAALRFE